MAGVSNFLLLKSKITTEQMDEDALTLTTPSTQPQRTRQPLNNSLDRNRNRVTAAGREKISENKEEEEVDQQEDDSGVATTTRRSLFKPRKRRPGLFPRYRHTFSGQIHIYAIPKDVFSTKYLVSVAT